MSQGLAIGLAVAAIAVVTALLIWYFWPRITGHDAAAPAPAQALVPAPAPAPVPAPAPAQ